ncbi:unnamed protein product [Mytilus edulis]|uniref:Queuosine salvage protein n=1 Tax=Mytilus edulis TaxID=6550 RepID=A0A8S3VN65_MYTED|nr:unnamed protein product [Mytilus edulis]
MSKAVGQNDKMQTFDQQLYAIAQQVKRSMPQIFHSHVVRSGDFHMVSCYISAIGKIWASAGLRHLMVDSGAYAGYSVDQILQGTQFNRGVRAYTLAYETEYHSHLYLLAEEVLLGQNINEEELTGAEYILEEFDKLFPLLYNKSSGGLDFNQCLATLRIFWAISAADLCAIQRVSVNGEKLHCKEYSQWRVEYATYKGHQGCKSLLTME